MATFDDQLEKARTQKGFVAALDQSGGSTPKALRLYGVGEDQYSNDEEMFTRVHEMRTRIITSPAFDHRILATILFENTLDRDIEGKNSARYLWEEKNILPVLKVDKGLDAEADGAQLMKPIPNLNELLDKAKAQNVFGTKMRSVIKSANQAGIAANVAQQFDIGRQIVAAGLIPILEPEIDINAPDKADAEGILLDELMANLAKLSANETVMFKLTLPETANHYKPCQDHANVLKVVALSGGYSREEANRRLAQNNGMIASFSRALTEGLSAQQTDEEFNSLLDSSIQSIYDASCT